MVTAAEWGTATYLTHPTIRPFVNASGLLGSDSSWCPEPDSNRHARKREILSLLCTTNFTTGAIILVRLEGIEPPYNALEEHCVIHYATVAVAFFINRLKTILI